MRLTKTKVLAARYDPDGPSQQVLWCEREPGLGLRLYPSGTKRWILREPYGRRRSFTLGCVDALTVEQARELVRRMRVRHYEERTHARLNTKGVTVRELLEAYLRTIQGSKSFDKTKYRIEKYILPRLGKHDATQLTGADLTAFHQSYSEVPTTANRLIEVLSAAFNVGIRMQRVKENPASLVIRHKEKSRETFLQRGDIDKLRRALAQESEKVRGAIGLLLYTGLRKSEVLKLRWSDIDFDQKLAIVHDTKNGTTKIKPLSDPALELIKNLRGDSLASGLIFTGDRGVGVTDLQKPWARVKRLTSIDATLHDLRRTVGSWLAQEGFTDLQIGQVLNHKSVAATRVYSRLRTDDERKAMETQAKMVGNW